MSLIWCYKTSVVLRFVAEKCRSLKSLDLQWNSTRVVVGLLVNAILCGPVLSVAQFVWDVRGSLLAETAAWISISLKLAELHVRNLFCLVVWFTVVTVVSFRFL